MLVPIVGQHAYFLELASMDLELPPPSDRKDHLGETSLAHPEVVFLVLCPGPVTFGADSVFICGST